MSSADLCTYNQRQLRRLKAIRRERLRPLRRFIESLPCSIGMHGTDSEKCFLRAHCGIRSLTIDLARPLNDIAIYRFLHEEINCARDRLDEYECAVEEAENGA